MSFASTDQIMIHVGQALSFDLLGEKHDPQTEDEEDADNAVNAGLDPRNDEAIVESVLRYHVPPELAADIWLERGGTGTAVGYSVGLDTPSTERGGGGAALHRVMPVEVTIMRVIDDLGEMLTSDPGLKIDRIHDEISHILSMDRRDARRYPDGFQTITYEDSRKLEGGGSEGGPYWTGRTMNWNVQRNWLDV